MIVKDHNTIDFGFFISPYSGRVVWLLVLTREMRFKVRSDENITFHFLQIYLKLSNFHKKNSDL